MYSPRDSLGDYRINKVGHSNQKTSKKKLESSLTVVSEQRTTVDPPVGSDNIGGKALQGSSSTFNRLFSTNDPFVDCYLETLRKLIPFRYHRFLSEKHATPEQIARFTDAIVNWRANICDFERAGNLSQVGNLLQPMRQNAEREFLSRRNIEIESALGSGSAREFSLFREASNEEDIASEIAKFAVLTHGTMSETQSGRVVRALQDNQIEIRITGRKVNAPSESQYLSALTSLQGVIPDDQLEFLAVYLTDIKLKNTNFENKP